MDMSLPQQNAIAAIRVSSIKQGLQGDSPEAQKEQIERFAISHNIHIKKFFIFMESASGEKQPVQEAVDFCKDPHNDIQLFVIKSIDRFTRGGSYAYDHMKMQLMQFGVKLIDIYGIIGAEQVNTLEHLGVSFDWSVYSPTKKSEILEAERAKDEMRDIMSRMIGAEVRYVRLGYRVRAAPYGYVNEAAETPHGRRIILKPHPTESDWIRKMFELRTRSTMTDSQIVAQLNSLGFQSRKMLVRDKNTRLVIGEKGCNKIILKQFLRYIQNPIYAGVTKDKWTEGKPIKCRFDGIVTIDEFNKAQRGKMTIYEKDGEIIITKKKPLEWRLKKGVRNPDFPYKKCVTCPDCQKPLFGSASRGKSGKHYPAYHCSKKDHHFRVATDKFNTTIKDFVNRIKFHPNYVNDLMEAVKTEWETRQKDINQEQIIVDEKIATLNVQAKALVEKIKVLSSSTAIKYIEDDLTSVEQEIKRLEMTRGEVVRESINMDAVVALCKFFMDNMHYLLLGSPDPITRATYFSLIFDAAPTYKEINGGTPKLADCIELNDKYNGDKGQLAHHFAFNQTFFIWRTHLLTNCHFVSCLY